MHRRELLRPDLGDGGVQLRAGVLGLGVGDRVDNRDNNVQIL